MSENQVSTAASLRLEIDGPLAWIVADNPARMNAFSWSMWAAVPRLIAAAEDDPGIRVIVLRGAGARAFSAGADISEFESTRTGAKAKEYDALSDAAFTAMASARKPTMAMVHGFCLGGGLGLAASCDLRLADEKATFAIPAAKLGIGYDPRWVRTLLTLCGPARLKELLYTAQRFSVEEALRMGLVNRIIPAALLETETRNLALEIAANAPLTLAAAKLAIDEIMRRPEHPDTAALARAIDACFESDDYAEGRRAFIDKRRPLFKGR